MSVTYQIDAPEVSMKVVRFTSGCNRGRIAKLTSMEIRSNENIDVVIFLDGKNHWDFLSCHVCLGDWVELFNGTLSEIEVSDGIAPALPRRKEII